MRIPRIVALVGCCLVLLGGCETDPSPVDGAAEARFRNAVPAVESLTIALPGLAAPTSNAGPFAVQTGALVGEVSGLWQSSRDASRAINDVMSAIHTPLGWVVQNVDPIVEDGAIAYWFGRSEDGIRDWVLTVDEKDDGHFDYAFATRPAETEDEWVAHIAGSSTPGSTAGDGQGAVWMDFSRDANSATSGTILALWSKHGDERTLTVYLFQVQGEADANGVVPAPYDAVYHHESAADGSGRLVYALQNVDIHQHPAWSLRENATIVTRWDADGVGRSDMWATDGDIARVGAEFALLTECWRREVFTVGYTSLVTKRPQVEVDVDFSEGDPVFCPYDTVGEPTLPEFPERPPAPEV